MDKLSIQRGAVRAALPGAAGRVRKHRDMGTTFSYQSTADGCPRTVFVTKPEPGKPLAVVYGDLTLWVAYDHALKFAGVE